MSQRIKDHVQRMSRDEKFEEFRRYLVTARVLNLDIDRIKMDQAIVGAPDSAIDDALVTCAYLTGSMLGQPPMTAQEVLDSMKQRRDERPRENNAMEQSVNQLSEPRVGMRKNPNSGK